MFKLERAVSRAAADVIVMRSPFELVDVLGDLLFVGIDNPVTSALGIVRSVPAMHASREIRSIQESVKAMLLQCYPQGDPEYEAIKSLPTVYNAGALIRLSCTACIRRVC